MLIFFPQSTIKTTGKGAMFSIFKPKKPKLVIVEVKTAFSNAYVMLREEYVLPEHKQVEETKFYKEEIEWMEEGGVLYQLMHSSIQLFIFQYLI